MSEQTDFAALAERLTALEARIAGSAPAEPAPAQLAEPAPAPEAPEDIAARIVARLR